MNVAAIVESHRSRDEAALVHHHHEVSYRDLQTTIDAVHRSLVAIGAGPDDRVAVIAGTTPDFVAVLFGILRAGCVAVPLNPLSPAPEMQAELDQVDVSVAFVGPAGAHAATDCRLPPRVIALHGVVHDGWTAFGDFVVSGAPPDLVARRAEDLALLLFTSGTAGASKAAMLTHGNLTANIEQVDAANAELALPDDVVLGVLPLFHILGLNLLLGVTLRAGATIVLVERFDPATTVDLVRERGVTVISGPPAMWQAWADLPGVDASAFSTVRIAISGGAALPKSVAERVAERLGISLAQGYGLTEAAPVLTLGLGTGAPAVSVGRPLPGVRLRLVDDQGHDVPGGDRGEVWASGPNIFPGYWHDADATARALTDDGWLRTGDIAVVDDDGFLYIVDRSKDMIVVSGFNVFPGEVEEVLRRHPAIAEAAVVGVPHPTTGEAVRAVVVAVEGATVNEHEIVRHCEAHLARYKCPRVVDVVDELPRGGAVDKVRRRQLR